MTLEEIQSVTFDDNSMLDEYKTKPLTRNSLFLINGNHYIVDAVGSGKITLLSKLIVIYKQRINPFILYFYNFGADETMALNLNSKNIVLTNITYEKAMYFLSQFDEFKYSVKEVYTYWKLRELNISYKSDYIQRMKERIIQNNPIKENPTRLASVSAEKQMEKPRDYVRRIAEIFEQECIDKITKYSVPTMIMRFIFQAFIHNVYFERKFHISQEDGDAELKITIIPILFHSSLQNSLLIFDDIGSNADIQRFSSGLAKTITHLVSDSRHSKNTVFFVAQRPSYLFKTARMLSHVICLSVNLSESDLKQAYEENSIWNLDFEEFMLVYGTLNNELGNEVAQLPNDAGKNLELTTDISNTFINIIWFPIFDIIFKKINKFQQLIIRGYYLLNTDIQQLENSANGDFAFSAESGTVWMYDAAWYNSGDIVPDQVTPASDATPLVDSGTGVAGTSTEYSRGDHKHQLQVSDVLPSKDTSVGTVGQASSYARSDHQHPIQTVDTIPVTNSADRSYDTVDSYARNDHSHPINVQTNASIVPVVNGVGNNGTSAYYSSYDHIHPQQLTYDGNLTATKFIKSGGTSNDILLPDGSTKSIVYAIRAEQITTTVKYIKLCTFNPLLQNNCMSVEFRYCMQEAYALYYGAGATRTCELRIQLTVWSNDVVIDYTNSGTVTAPITNILTSSPVDELPTDYEAMYQLTTNLQLEYQTVNNAPFTQNGLLQINTTGNNYNQGIRISGSISDSYSRIFLGCNSKSTTGTQARQWSILAAPNGEFRIAVNTQASQENRGLIISPDGITLTFNGRVL
ncbi:MAG: hypothetical protein EZS28_013250 [Streblomastix strix]|uniref:Uncharacterized protein n=1 Tax=Streblomastix strix TaxID=222440 RepID=A0A5J4W994_9EUKA|nr:MAG: hypothetical protein EZS28_013250 [Streblomastix strix]